MPRTMIPADDVKLCDCAKCGREMLGESMKYVAFGRLPPEYRCLYPVFARVRDRPYCALCYPFVKPSPEE